MRGVHGFLIFLGVVFFPLFGQEKFEISGFIVDENGSGVEARLNFLDRSNLVQTSKSDSIGLFKIDLTEGNYHLKISANTFVAYEEFIQISNDTDLGFIALVQENSEKKLEEELGTSSVLRVRKKLLRKKEGALIYDVTQDANALGGSVTDVLENVPSVQVDEEGNVTLRGNNVRVLINGKQSALVGSGNETTNLQSLSANQIESIEVINNPSARFDAEGQGGIINLILKDDGKRGWNATLRAYSGVPTNSGGDVNWSYKNKDASVFGVFSARYQEPPANTAFKNQFFTDGTLDSIEIQNSERLKEQLDLNFTLGTEYKLDKVQTLRLSGVYGLSDQMNTRRIFYNDFDANGLLTEQSNRVESENEDRYTIEGNLDYSLKFRKKGHGLQFSGRASFSNEEENSDIPENTTFSSSGVDLGLTDFTQTGNDQIQRSFTLQSDYQLPLLSDMKFEVGTKFNNRINDNSIFVLQQNVNSEEFFTNPDFTGNTKYNESVYAAYWQMRNSFEKWSYSLGLRMEHSNIVLNQSEISQRNIYTDWFPSFYLGYEYNRGKTLDLNYSRRIRRPFTFFLVPFFTFSDDRNTFQGNPELQPSYTDKVELSFNTKLKKLNLTPSIYFSYENQPLQIARNLGSISDPVNGDTDDIFIATPVNIDQRIQYGIELLLQYQFKKNWSLLSTINTYQFAQKGEVNGISLEDDGFRWNGQLSLKGNLPYEIRSQINVNYLGRQENGQLTREGVFYTNLGFSKKIFKKKASLALTIIDIFNSRKRDVINEGEDFRSDLDLQFRERQINLTFTYTLRADTTNKREKDVLPRDRGIGGGF